MRPSGVHIALMLGVCGCTNIAQKLGFVLQIVVAEPAALVLGRTTAVLPTSPSDLLAFASKANKPDTQNPRTLGCEQL